MKKRYLLILSIICLLIGIFLTTNPLHRPATTPKNIATNYPINFPTTPTEPPIATPTAKPLTFEEKNALYGPCTRLPILMFHHIEELDKAKEGGYASLSVTPEFFKKDLEYLKEHNYQVIGPEDLIAFFDEDKPLPKKSIMLTFDDGYSDFAVNAAPLLLEFGYKAQVYLPTGLMENTGYLTWKEIASLSEQNIYFGNHTWSHHSMSTNLATITKEIELAETQLKDHGLNNSKTFVYPFGTISKEAVKFVEDSDYKLAFTTVSGSMQCKKQRFTLPRIRIGNAPLSSYGL